MFSVVGSVERCIGTFHTRNNPRLMTHDTWYPGNSLGESYIVYDAHNIVVCTKIHTVQYKE